MCYTHCLVIEPKKSLSLFIVLLVSHLVGVIVVLILVKNHWFIQLIVLLLIGFSWFYYYRLHITKVLSQSVLAAYHQQDKGWSIKLVSTKNKTQNNDKGVCLMDSSYVSQWWIILNFHHIDSVDNRDKNSCYTLLIPKDSVSAETHRQLRVRLKIM